jgi:hypothetical protein
MAGFGESLSNYFLGTEGGYKQVPRLSTQQMQLQNMAGGSAQQLLPQVQQGFNFEPIAQQARTQFNTQTIPSLAQRFTGLGQSRAGSDYMHALGSAGAGLEQNLASLGAQYGFQNQGRQQQLLMSLLSLALQPQFENVYQGGEQGAFASILPALASLGGKAAGAYFGMPFMF